MSGCAQLPKKLGLTVQEYLRQRERGSIESRASIAVQVALLLRAAALCVGDAPDVVRRTREALLEHDRSELVIRALSERVLEILQRGPDERTGLLAAFVQEVREAESELGEQTSSALAGPVAVLAPAREGSVLADAAALALERSQTMRNAEAPSLRVIVASPPTDAAKGLGKQLAAAGVPAQDFGDWQAAAALRGAGKLVIVGHALHRAYGCAADSGARMAAKAARRAGVPVVVAVPRYALLQGDLGCGMRRVRAHPGAVWDYEDVAPGQAVEVVVREFDWVPLTEVDLVITEFGGYAPEFMMRAA